MKFVLQVVGLALALAGGLWTLQGLGLVMWPAESFMLAQKEWAIYGALTVLIGVALFIYGSRRRQ